MARTVIILAKAPRIGTAKTRLARDIGAISAWRVNRRLNQHTLKETRDPRWNTVLSVAARRDLHEALPGVWPPPGGRIEQRRSGLGERLEHLFRQALRGPVIVLGTDCPGLRSRDLAEAFRALQHNDVVIGPAADGGFWLLGLAAKRAKAARFKDVRWSHAETLHDTLSALAAPKAYRLRTLADVDDGPSYRAASWVKRRSGTSSKAAKRG